MKRILRWAVLVIALAVVFSGGYVAGENKFGQPTTVIHVVIIKWKPGASLADQQKALDGGREMAAKIPGIKNVWIKAERVQPRDYDAVFAIEFENRAAADRYAESPVHAAWAKPYLAIRQASLSEQVTN